ncbi:MAG: S-layer homology domain-containing protein [Clostridia bacterium]|nr:S-layer homology domain-containing protein [Clostridia bacterium]
MKKHQIVIALFSLLFLLLAVAAAAAPDAVAYMAADTGNDANDGLTAETPKKTFSSTSGKGVMGILKDGGTLVLVGKGYLSADFTLPQTSGPITFTSVYDGKDYKNEEPKTNPATGFKMAGGKTMTIVSDVTLDDMILFQENAQNTIRVAKGGKLTVTENIVCMAKKDQYMKIIVDAGGKAVINGGIFDSVSGAGEIVLGDKAVILESDTATETLTPVIPADAGPYAYMAADTGDDTNDGLTPATPKKTFSSTSGSGVMGMLKNGGTLVLVGKGYISADFTLPKARGPITVTSVFGGIDHKNAEPKTNPATGFKMAGGKTLTIVSDVTLDDMILFQENGQNTIRVTGGATLTVTDKIVCMSKQSYYMNIEVEAGSSAVIGGGIFSSVSGDGEITISKNANILDRAADVPDDGFAEVVYLSTSGGSDDADGLTPATAKRTFGAADGSGAISVVKKGGTVVVTGKAYYGGNGSLPQTTAPLVFTSVYDGVDYKNASPAENPACAFKLASGCTLTLPGEVVFDDLILFQEFEQNTLKVPAGATLVVTDKAVLLSKPGLDYHYRILIEEGGTAILSQNAQKVFTIDNQGGALETYGGGKTENGFAATRTYADSFTDVTENKWFYPYVKTAYEYGLANGTSQTAFSPDDKFTVAQALTAAVNIHKAYFGGEVAKAGDGQAWYVPYVNYCIEKGIIKDGQFDSYDRSITRGEMAAVFANILPDEEYAAVRSGSCPDVTPDMTCAAAVAKLFAAGIVGGDAGTGNYRPDDSIVRSEACVIFTRIAAKEYRAK